MPYLGPLSLRAGHRALVVLAVGCLEVGCAHGTTVTAEPVSQDELAALRRDNATLRRHVAELEDRVVRLESDAGHLGADARGLPVVRLQPPRGKARPDMPEADAQDDPEPRHRGRPGRTLGDLPNSAGPAEGWSDDDAGLAESGGNAGSPGSYRLVGDRLVQLTKQNAPTRPDRPARDAAGNAILTEYETAMALYKAGEIAGAERAFDLFAKAHAQHDYADNALYWKGEAAYDQQHFDDALSAFTEVVERYGGGNKAPDALLKIGLCYGRLGDSANARDVLTGLVDAYPDARAAELARARLAEYEG
jgi:tol-pal system protein YbgF